MRPRVVLGISGASGAALGLDAARMLHSAGAEIDLVVSPMAERTLTDDDTVMRVNLAFNSMADFEPARVVEQVPALKSLLESRNRLRDLLAKADRSEQLEQLLEEVLQDNEAVRKLMGEVASRTGTSKEGAE